MKPAEFKKYLARDEVCWHCGRADDTLVPQHRIGRGMGGSKTLDCPSNIIVFCSLANGLLESDPQFATEARNRGWKLASWQSTENTMIWDSATASWYLLDDQYGRFLLWPE